MKISKFYTLILLVGISLLSACNLFTPKGNGSIVEEDYQLSGFDEINVKGNFFIHLAQGNDYSVVVRTDENLLDEIQVKMKDDKLVIKSNNAIRPSRENHLYITVPYIVKMVLSGANTLRSAGTISQEKVDIQLNGASNLFMEIDMGLLNVEINGAGEAEFTGIADEAKMQINGAGKLFGEELKIIKADVNINGAGRCEINVEELLNASINGVGTLRYLGEPELKTSINGAGSIEKFEE